MKVELRHLEIAELLRKVLEMDEENRWDESMILQQPSSGADDADLDHASPADGAPQPDGGGDAIEPADDGTVPTSDAAASIRAGKLDSDDDDGPGGPLKKKRRNIFRRAISALRRRFSSRAGTRPPPVAAAA